MVCYEVFQHICGHVLADWLRSHVFKGAKGGGRGTFVQSRGLILLIARLLQFSERSLFRANTQQQRDDTQASFCDCLG